MTLSKMNKLPHLTRGSVRIFAGPVATAFAVAAMAVPMVASAATAQTITAKAHGEKISVTVPTDLLTTEEGAARIYRALQRKAEKSCKKTIPIRLGASVNVKRCTGKLLDGFVAELDHAGMTTLHASAE